MVTELQGKTPTSPQPGVFAAPARPTARLFAPRLAPALVSGGLLWLCYFPVAWGWLAWVALVPLLCLVRTPGRPLVIYLSAWAGGVTFFLPALYWMSVADHRMVYAWIALALYCALYFPAAIFLLRRLERTPLPLIVTVPVVWTSLEFVRSFLLTGFPWYFLGHSQHAYLGIIQIADVTGAYGVSFLVAAVNAWLFERLYAVSQFRQLLQLPEVGPATPRWARALQTVAVVGMIFGVLAYGAWRLDQEDFKPGPRIVLLQANLDQRLRNRAAFDAEAGRAFTQHYGPLVELALRQGADLIIWPETSYHSEWLESTVQPVPERLKTAQFAILEPILQSKTNHLLGTNTIVLHQNRERTLHVSALLVTSRADFSQRYDKIHRVPFGEYVPLRDWLPFLKSFSPYDYDYNISVGEKPTRFVLGKHSFGVLICFEATDAALARQYAVYDSARSRPPVDFLVNMSNDGWFDGTSEHEEHLAISRFRAIECRRAMVRAVNMGISAVIDGNGRVLEPQLVSFDAPLKNWVLVEGNGRVPDLPESRWHQFKKVHGILTATVPIDDRSSFYAQWGDWLPVACCILIAAVLVWRPVKRIWNGPDRAGSSSPAGYRVPQVKPHVTP